MKNAASLRSDAYDHADHPLEVQPGNDALGNFHWPTRAKAFIAALDAFLLKHLAPRE